MTHWMCPYCGEPLANAQSPHCGEAGHAEEVEDNDHEYEDFIMDRASETSEHTQ